MTEHRDDFAAWLKNRLAEKGWRQADLVRASGVDDAYMSRVMTRATIPGCDFCIKITQALGVPVAETLMAAGLIPRAMGTDRARLDGWINLLNAEGVSLLLKIVRSLSHDYALEAVTPTKKGRQRKLADSERWAKIMERLENATPEKQDEAETALNDLFNDFQPDEGGEEIEGVNDATHGSGTDVDEVEETDPGQQEGV